LPGLEAPPPATCNTGNPPNVARRWVGLRTNRQRPRRGGRVQCPKTRGTMRGGGGSGGV
ncbi:ser thr protein phosphatase family, partial [Nannochloropsis gaditana CCMP526]|uniref:ser thr protein phosphatase family n=1 Tax=Nannochloropsis gaditana (strain CCMP526) TaxID=1093141 RepID=UPI00029F6C0E